MKYNYTKITLWANLAFILVMTLLLGLMPGGIYEPGFSIMELLLGHLVGLLIVLCFFGAPMVAAQVCAWELHIHPGSRRHSLTWILALLQAPMSVALYMVVELFLKLLNALDKVSAPVWVDKAINAEELYAKLGFGGLILYSIGLVIACEFCRYKFEDKVFIVILMGWQVIVWTMQLLMTLGWLRS